MITCKVCGTVNPDGTQYCEGCGVELTPAEASPTAPAPEASAPANPAPVADPTPTEASAPASEPIPEPTAPAPVPAPEVAPAPDRAEAAPIPTAAPALRPAKLTIKRFGAPTSDVIPLNGSRMVLGRFDASSGPVDIDLSGVPGNENLSRHHAELFFDGQWKVRDLGSTNGVFVKRAGETGFSPRLVEPTAIANGDELAFGNIIMLFEEG